jgi:hypothetical protein
MQESLAFIGCHGNDAFVRTMLYSVRATLTSIMWNKQIVCTILKHAYKVLRESSSTNAFLLMFHHLYLPHLQIITHAYATNQNNITYWKLLLATYAFIKRHIQSGLGSRMLCFDNNCIILKPGSHTIAVIRFVFCFWHSPASIGD